MISHQLASASLAARFTCKKVVFSGRDAGQVAAKPSQRRPCNKAQRTVLMCTSCSSQLCDAAWPCIVRTDIIKSSELYSRPENLFTCACRDLASRSCSTCARYDLIMPDQACHAALHPDIIMQDPGSSLSFTIYFADYPCPTCTPALRPVLQPVALVNRSKPICMAASLDLGRRSKKAGMCSPILRQHAVYLMHALSSQSGLTR